MSDSARNTGGIPPHSTEGTIFIKGVSVKAVNFVMFIVAFLFLIHAVAPIHAVAHHSALRVATPAGASRPLLTRLAMVAEMADADGALFAAALGCAAYASGYATEGYEPHKQ